MPVSELSKFIEVIWLCYEDTKSQLEIASRFSLAALCRMNYASRASTMMRSRGC
jgi:hypothetical protein